MMRDLISIIRTFIIAEKNNMIKACSHPVGACHSNAAFKPFRQGFVSGDVQKGEAEKYCTWKKWKG